jgi:signal transduction histidine kinase
LLEVVQRLSQVRSDHQIRDIVQRAARQLLDADGATFVLRDVDRCYYVDEDAIGPLWKGQKFPMSACISGWAMLHRQPAVIPDIYADPRIPHDAYRPTFVRSLVMTPIRAVDPIGAIGIYWAREYAATAAEVGLVQALADTTSVAIENVRLINDLEERVQARTAQLTRLIGIVSHELRSPLAGVRGALDIAVREAEPHTAHPMIEMALRSTDQMLSIANDLLDLDRAEAGELRVRPVPTRTAEICRRVSDTAEPLAAAAGVHFTTDIHDHPVTADPERLTQALVNVIANAIKFSPPAATVHLSSSPGDGITTFEVTDAGRGIPADQLERIFNRYTQVDPDTDTRIAGGAGLGLAISHAIITAHHATITVQSTPGVGSTFTIRLPTPG